MKNKEAKTNFTEAEIKELIELSEDVYGGQGSPVESKLYRFWAAFRKTANLSSEDWRKSDIYY